MISLYSYPDDGDLIMNAETALAQVEQCGLVAAARGNFPPPVALKLARVLMDAGINIFEFTMNSVQPLEAMQAVKREYGDAAVVGMGTVLDVDTAKRAIDAGADMIIAPSFDPDVVRVTLEAGLLAVPGVLTPTEIVNAWNLGAQLLKIFPIGAMGLEYFKSVRAPLGHVKFMCNGGMTDENIGAYMKAGAVACGMAGWLTGDGSWPVEKVAQRAQKLRAIVDATRRGEAVPQQA